MLTFVGEIKNTGKNRENSIRDRKLRIVVTRRKRKMKIRIVGKRNEQTKMSKTAESA